MLAEDSFFSTLEDTQSAARQGSVRSFAHSRQASSRSRRAGGPDAGDDGGLAVVAAVAHRARVANSMRESLRKERLDLYMTRNARGRGKAQPAVHPRLNGLQVIPL
jgi:hypothetical protein